MVEKQKAILMGPFVGELYWEAGRFVPLLPRLFKQNFDKNVKYIILTREDRFDLYGKYADILVPLRIEGDYVDKHPECFRLIGLSVERYEQIATNFKNKYKDRYKIIRHIYPNIKKPFFSNKNQFPVGEMLYRYKPRQDNYDLVDKYLPTDKPLVILSPRYRKGFRRNWEKWPKFYDLLSQSDLMNKFNFIVCGKPGEYMPDKKHRFLDMNDIELSGNSSLVGLLLVILQRAIFTCGSQSAIPNLSLLHGVEVLEFGCQKMLHTKTYNIKKTPITFLENRNYDIEPNLLLKNLQTLLEKKGEK